MLRSMARLLLGYVVIVSIGCGGGGSSSTSAKSFLLQFVGTNPGNGATDVPVTTTQITVSCDRDVNPSTVNTANVFVNESGTGGLVQGTVSMASARDIVWTLAAGQHLNSQLPNSDVLAFDRFYTITVTKGLRSTAGEPPQFQLTSAFRTVAMQYSVVAAGSDPTPGATGVLIEPARYASSNGVVLESTVKAKIDVPLDSASVQAAGNVFLRVAAGGAKVDGTTFFDSGANTIYFTVSPGQHTGFPLEPVLMTATSYLFVVSKNVLPQGGAASPPADLEMPFATGGFVIRPPAQTATVADLTVNEVFAAPTNVTANSDANGDGFGQTGHDEFIEIANISNDYINMDGYEIRDSSGTSAPLFAFNATNFQAGTKFRALVPPGAVFTVFNGGTIVGTGNVPAAGQIPASKLAVGHSKFFSANRSSGSASQGYWDNSPGDTAVIKNTASGLTSMTFTYGTNGSPSATVPSGASLTRSPDITGNLTTNHSTLGRNFSPGVKTDGTVFK